MVSCKSILCVLLVATTLITVTESVGSTVKVEFNDTAGLPCSGSCSGVVGWTWFSEPSKVLAKCDQTECRSVKKGYRMIRNQYLQGNLSLIITEADFSKRGVYTCDCNGRALGEVVLQIKPLKSTVQKKAGETLELDLYISDGVEVIYNSTGAAGPSSGHICTVNRRSVQLNREYSDRASVSSALTLREVQESDSGVYTVRDLENKEIIYIYTVNVYGKSEDQKRKASDSNPSAAPVQEAALPLWAVALVVLGVMLVVSVVVNMWQCRKAGCPQRESTGNGITTNNSVQASETVLSLQHLLISSNNQEHT